MSVDNQNELINEQLQNENFLKEVITQLNKDFNKIGITIEIPLNVKAEKVSELLVKMIDTINNSAHSEKIKQLLYIIDVPEETITDLMIENPELNYSNIIVFTLIRREIQKILFRKQYSNKN